MKPAHRNFTIGGIILAVPFAYAIWRGIGEPPLENCKDTVKSSIVVVVDQTDLLSGPTIDSIKYIVDEAIRKAASHTVLSVYYVKGDSIPKKPDIKVCIPPQKTLATAITEDEEAVDNTWRNFKKRFIGDLMKSTTPSPSSPIYETIVNIARDKTIVRDPSKTEFLIFSDFAQNSNIINLHTDCINSEQNLRVITQAIVYDATDRPLSNITVGRYMIPRDTRSRDTIACLQKTSDMVFNRLGMGTAQAGSIVFEYLPKSP